MLQRLRKLVEIISSNLEKVYKVEGKRFRVEGIYFKMMKLDLQTLYLIPHSIYLLYMKIEHIAVWTNQLDALKAFYVQFFKASCNEKYHNPHKQFNSYFLSFDNGARLELMQMPGIPANSNDVMRQHTGLIHFALSTGSKEKVDALTEEIGHAGIAVLSEPRWTGDGYYESVILDPDSNRVEITI